MTVEEAAQKIKEFIQSRGGGVSFMELKNLLGDDGLGDAWIGQPDYNIWWWFGMSPLFVDALSSLRDEIEPEPASTLVYMIDGGVPNLPIVKRARHYKEPHWIPVVWNMRRKASKG